MTDLTYNHLDGVRWSGLVARALDFTRKMFGRYHEYRAKRNRQADVRGLNDHTLADIGVTHSEITCLALTHV